MVRRVARGGLCARAAKRPGDVVTGSAICCSCRSLPASSPCLVRRMRERGKMKVVVVVLRRCALVCLAAPRVPLLPSEANPPEVSAGSSSESLVIVAYFNMAAEYEHLRSPVEARPPCAAALAWVAVRSALRTPFAWVRAWAPLALERCSCEDLGCGCAHGARQRQCVSQPSWPAAPARHLASPAARPQPALPPATWPALPPHPYLAPVAPRCRLAQGNRPAATFSTAGS